MFLGPFFILILLICLMIFLSFDALKAIKAFRKAAAHQAAPIRLHSLIAFLSILCFGVLVLGDITSSGPIIGINFLAVLGGIYAVSYMYTANINIGAKCDVDAKDKDLL